MSSNGLDSLICHVWLRVVAYSASTIVSVIHFTISNVKVTNKPTVAIIITNRQRASIVDAIKSNDVTNADAGGGAIFYVTITTTND